MTNQQPVIESGWEEADYMRVVYRDAQGRRCTSFWRPQDIAEAMQTSASLSAPPELLNQWQPIASAPRDGTPVDLWHRDGFRITEQWWTDDGCWSCVMDDDDFTHWMPLPAPPTKRPQCTTP